MKAVQSLVNIGTASVGVAAATGVAVGLWTKMDRPTQERVIFHAGHLGDTPGILNVQNHLFYTTDPAKAIWFAQHGSSVFRPGEGTLSKPRLYTMETNAPHRIGLFGGHTYLPDGASVRIIDIQPIQITEEMREERDAEVKLAETSSPFAS